MPQLSDESTLLAPQHTLDMSNHSLSSIAWLSNTINAFSNATGHGYHILTYNSYTLAASPIITAACHARGMAAWC